MQNIIDTCEPRRDIVEGTFNPEIFTASLSEVIKFYKSNRQGVHEIYTDAEQFFSAGTYATQGFKMVLNEVFARLAGDGTAPAIHRLDTAFGGGKTHTLIACAHIAYKGRELAPHISHLVEPKWIPEKGGIDVAGIAGNEIPVHKPKGTSLIPYTLWGEIAYQIGGEELYRQVDESAGAFAAPGKDYFETVFNERKVLLMIDELAQYAARLSAAKTDGSEQLAAFLMSLHEYARSNPGISIILTLASATDAFAKQTSQLAKLLSKITGKEMHTDDALGIGQQAVESIASVISRDATSVVPVQASEISRVLAKRLFTHIEVSAAKQTAGAYREMYQKNSSMLPDEATRDDFHEHLISHYPFHPSFIDFLNHKLATYENFQGTRGVLRILALAVRAIWHDKTEIPMIHTCHLDLRNARTVNEVIGRSGSGDLLPVLNADVGGADTDRLTGGRSNAELADRKNPHPLGWPLHEFTWKTVFLHSLVGRDQGINSSAFGLTEQEALFDVSFPGMTPSQVSEALKEINNSAFYLRFNHGKYYASLDPSVNVALAKLRRGLQAPAVYNLLAATVKKIVKQSVSPFNIIYDVTAPEDIPDNKGKPSLAMIALKADPLIIDEFITTTAQGRPRIEQNLVFLLVPDTVQTSQQQQQQDFKLDESPNATDENRRKLNELARTVLAMRELKKNPQNYGIHPKKLEENEFTQRQNERENSLLSLVAESYRNLWYPSANGQTVCQEIRTSGGESGTSIIEQIREVLQNNNELITSEHISHSILTNFKKLFFAKQDIVDILELNNNFCRKRNWPILESPNLLNHIIREGVRRDIWHMFRMGNEETTVPDELYSRESDGIPFDVDIKKGYSLIKPEGAKQRGWGKTKGPEQHRIQDWIRTVIKESPTATVSEVSDKLNAKFGSVQEKDFKYAVSDLIKENRIFAYKGDAEQDDKPELIKGDNAALYMPANDDTLLTPAEAAKKGWVDESGNSINLSSKEGANIIMPMLRKLGSIYERGAKSRVDMLDIIDMELPNGGTLRIVVENATPESMKDLGELFEVIHGSVKSGDDTLCDLNIDHPEPGCTFADELKQIQNNQKHQ
ncbi:MAG: DUF499 domain-containing protein [Verrucomicrobia bacterium]|nr:DUF499 domain-containing protein [Verrucomicrobiota bacterium]